MITRKSTEDSLFIKEKLNSKLKLAKSYIANNNFSSVFNNKKWRDLFYIIEKLNLTFEIKLILANKSFTVDEILELEESSILTNSTENNFINFLEIEELILDFNKEVFEFLKQKSIPYSKKNNKFILFGYIES